MGTPSIFHGVLQYWMSFLTQRGLILITGTLKSQRGEK